jgi:hypothetical protein
MTQTKPKLPPCRCKHAQSSHQNGICKTCTNNEVQKIATVLYEEYERQRIAYVNMKPPKKLTKAELDKLTKKLLSMKNEYILQEAAKGTACVDTDKKTPE